MNTHKQPGFDLFGTFVNLEIGGGAVPVEVDDDFWGKLDRKDLHYDARLVGAVHSSETGSSLWEMHPAGDEFLCLLSGAVDVVLKEGDVERVVELRNGKSCVVPRGVWHRQIIVEPSSLLFITPGAGTQHRPL